MVKNITCNVQESVIFDSSEVSQNTYVVIPSHSKNGSDLTFIYENQIEKSDDFSELSVFLILYGKRGKAAKRFNRETNNSGYLKLIVNEIMKEKSAENMAKLLVFIDEVEGYDQKMLLIDLFYKEFIKDIDPKVLSQLNKTLNKALEMPAFNSLGTYYKDNFQAIKSTIDTLETKFEPFMSKQKLGVITLEEVNEKLSDLKNYLDIISTNTNQQENWFEIGDKLSKMNGKIEKLQANTTDQILGK